MIFTYRIKNKESEPNDGKKVNNINSSKKNKDLKKKKNSQDF